MLGEMDGLRGDVGARGFAVVTKLLTDEETDDLIACLSAAQEDDGVRRKGGVYAIRNLLSAVPEVASLAVSPKVMKLVNCLLGENAIPVRGTLFDKTAEANWLVPWHQDLTICVKERIDLSGYGPWTVKAGVHHVQPPAAILERMLAVRIHLDDCDERNGALRVLPATHQSGRLTSEEIGLAQRCTKPTTCSVPRGGAVLMKPLTLHASSSALEPRHRRVIHIDFAAIDLPGGLRWLAD